MATNAEWDRRFMQLARVVASWSKDPSTKVGAVIVDEKNRILSLGFNGLPRGIDDSPERLNDRDVKLRLTLHAEHNAILFAPGDINASTIYVTAPPCAHCTAMLIQSGVKRIVFPEPDEAFVSRWGQDLQLAEAAAAEAGVERNTL